MNVVIVVSDDQRWDKITPEYTPNIWKLAQSNNSIDFQNAFVSNPMCCPSRTTILSGEYSHTTGVWTNTNGPYGGFAAFDDDHTLAVDFQQRGYRTAMIGKYLNGYNGGVVTYVPPGWTKWYATDTGDYYDYGVTTNHRLLHFGNRPRDYSTRVLQARAVKFIQHSTTPFFLYFAPSAPHDPAIPDPRDIGRFADQPDHEFLNHAADSSMLDSAYGVDRAVGKLLSVLPPNTVVLYMSDNGFMWDEAHDPYGTLSGKMWPFNSSVRVPMILSSLDGTHLPSIDPNTIVANVDVRDTLLHAAGLTPLTFEEGSDWYVEGGHDHLLIEHYPYPDYCGIRDTNFMYVRFKWDSGYSEELYDGDDKPATNPSLMDHYRTLAQTECDPSPPDYAWP